jgi:hypothetical protein
VLTLQHNTFVPLSMTSMLRYVALRTDEYDLQLPGQEKTLSIRNASKHIQTATKEIISKLPPPLPHRLNKHIYLLASVILSFFILHTFTKKASSNEHYKLAQHESKGFFKDIPASAWRATKDRVRNQPNHNDKELGLRSKYTNRNSPSTWYEHNWQVNFDCNSERRIGGTSEGSKWTCDPHRIVKATKKCLVYSFGRGSPNSRSFDFAFELNLLKEIGGAGSCEVHVFDHRLDDYGGEIPEGIIPHHWSLEGEIDAPRARKGFMTLKEIVHHLGHEGRELEVMRVDCEGCEWHTYPEWLNSGVEPRQLLVSFHGAPRNEDEVFEMMAQRNYVIFHREADTRYGGMWQEYGFLGLDSSFFK